MLNKLIARYSINRKALSVDFRKMVPQVRMGERATHYVHPYPAKLLPQIAHFFCGNGALSSPGDTILDPFGGTGTVGVESLIAGRSIVLADANPLARLISSVKCSKVTGKQIAAARRRLSAHLLVIREAQAPDVVNIDHWYKPAAKKALSRLSAAIMKESDLVARDLLLVTLSAAARKCSLADPRLSVAVRLKEKGNGGIALKKRWTQREVIALYMDQLQQNTDRLSDLQKRATSTSTLRRIFNDARDVQEWPEVLGPGWARLVVTSPPYAGAQKYIRASYLGLGWTELCRRDELRALEEKSIGREHHLKMSYSVPLVTNIKEADRQLARIRSSYPLRAHIAAKYLVEMREALGASVRALAPGGHFVLVAGNNSICGKRFFTADHLHTILRDLGLVTRLVLVDKIKSRGLMTKRNKTASLITREWIFVLQKPATPPS